MHPKRLGMLVRSIVKDHSILSFLAISTRLQLKNADFNGVQNAAGGADAVEMAVA